MTPMKGVQVTLPKALAERLVFLRKVKHKIPDMNQSIIDSLQDTVCKLESKARVGPDDWKVSKTCPICTSGVLLKKQNRKVQGGVFFYGCSRHPECRYTESFSKVLKGK
jgi:ssDNA-binding Zn-finger/Zn-ribbon topoisomerase 1